MSSTPLIASSSGAATVCAITVGFAPGKRVLTTTDGGTTSGYSEIGSLKIAISPPRKMRMDSTAAKIGRATKNLEKFMRGLLVCLVLLGGRDGHTRRRRRHHRHLLRRDRGAGAHALQAVDDDAFARLQAGAGHAQAVDGLAELDHAVLGLVVLAQHVDVLAVLVGADGRVVDHHARPPLP